MKLRTVLSLFDGISCGRLALDKAGIEYDKYYASEIDKHAIKVAAHNYPDTVELGDINKWREWTIDWSMVDLILAGSPCQGFSFAGKQLAFDDPRSKLFFVFLDILNHVKTVNPKVKFLLENVVMKKEFQEIITEKIGVEPILINSALLSAQNRKRLYWANWKIDQPQDKHILLKDIVETSDAYKCARITGRKINPETGRRDDYNEKLDTQQRIEPRIDDKAGTLTTVQKDNVLILQRARGNNPGGLRAENGKTPCMSANSWQDNNHLIKIDSYSPNCQRQINKNKKALHEKSIALCTNSNLTGSGVTPLDNGDGIHVRKLTPVECERLQTVPDNYTAAASNAQRYRMLGNGWTVDVIAHILSFLSKNEQATKQLRLDYA
jgi:DNA-cytosine methyltransferase